MVPTGEGSRKILFVAEAPGEQEDREGTQLIGKAGQLCRRLSREVGCDLDECWKTNAVICRPPENKIDKLYIESCRPNLLSTILSLKPKVVVLLGISAVDSLISPEWGGNLGPLGRWVGWSIPSHKYNAWICPTYHPSYIGRLNEDPTIVTLFKRHIAQALALENKPLPRETHKDLEKQVELIFSAEEGGKRMEALAEKEGFLAFDYETTGLKPEDEEQEIVSCSFCLDGTETFACPIDESNHEALGKVLLNPKLKKIASNLKFEERWSRAKLGHGAEGWFWDTMLTAHQLDNRPGITSIKFQAYIHMGVADYSSHIGPFLMSTGRGGRGINRIKELDPKDLLLYNGMDSLLEYRVAMLQRKELGW